MFKKIIILSTLSIISLGACEERLKEQVVELKTSMQNNLFYQKLTVGQKQDLDTDFNKFSDAYNKALSLDIKKILLPIKLKENNLKLQESFKHPTYLPDNNVEYLPEFLLSEQDKKNKQYIEEQYKLCRENVDLAIADSKIDQELDQAWRELKKFQDMLIQKITALKQAVNI